MKKRKRDRKTVMFGLPSYTGQLHIGTMQMIMGESQMLRHRGDRVIIEDRCGGADIAANRNDMLASFLASEATHLFMVDHDVIAARNSIVRMVDYELDFIAAVYPKRKEPIEIPMQYIDGTEGPIGHDSGLVELGGVAGGFVCLSRNCARKMVRAYADLQYISEIAPQNRAWAVFDPYWYEDERGRHRLSEDYSFCRRWRDIGGKVLVDPFIPMGHVGTKEYRVTLAEVMNLKGNLSDEQVRQLGLQREDRGKEAVPA